ncbi:hypothetical protein P8452_28387 [Trifolium repens]|nr:hypothetical protein P8452_28387 [Trifolium repens]
MNKAHFGLFFSLFILLACGMVILTDGRKCESKRRWIKGNCLSDEKCAADCLVKGFLSGIPTLGSGTYDALCAEMWGICEALTATFFRQDCLIIFPICHHHIACQLLARRWIRSLDTHLEWILQNRTS